MSQYIPYLSFGVWVTSLRMVLSSSIHLPANFKMSLFFTALLNVPYFPFPFFGWWASRLVPVSGYYKWYCYEQSWERFLVVWLYILRVYVQGWYCWGILIPSFLKKLPYWFPKWLFKVAFPPAMEECSPYSSSSPAETLISVFDLSHSYRYKMVSQKPFNLYFPDG